METGFPLFPEQASTLAARVDAIYLFLVGMSSVFIILIFVLIIYFTIRYRRRSDSDLPPAAIPTVRLEIAWTVIPLILVMISFAWGASVYMVIFQPPKDALEIRAVGRQWMWKFQHSNGASEINELHVPVGQPVKIVLASQDVIHSFYVPAFRVKMDVVPGRYTWAWFEATREGAFHLFCAEYCGTQHSGMIGRVYAMKPIDYQRWLSGQSGGESAALSGERLFRANGCATCHRQESGPLGPALHGLFGRPVKLQSGQTIVADEAYIRESILNPQAKIVAGYQPLMPTFQGQLDEETLHQLVVYLKTLGATEEAQRRP